MRLFSVEKKKKRKRSKSSKNLLVLFKTAVGIQNVELLCVHFLRSIYKGSHSLNSIFFLLKLSPLLLPQEQLEECKKGENVRYLPGFNPKPHVNLFGSSPQR